MNTYHVYAIVNSKTHDTYVGCTIHLKQRSWRHTDALIKGVHPSRQLQEAWTRDGPETFQFTVLLVLEGVTPKAARRAELIWISKIGTYNEIGADLESDKGTWSDQQKADQALRTKQRWADPELRKELAKGLRPENQFTKGNAPRKTKEMDDAHSAHMKAVWADPKKRIKLAARLAARWSDPQAKVKHSERMRAYHAARRAALAS